ncbi:ATP-binding cassette domain-containing protein [Methanoplanus endosymbiosus]|uniref:ATP-binding cassette domain-containing protein n=1 Tax=Methanoplanus endosymbiosus TaxID=33865 RepID=A0A9E7TKP7_9EURY|nr:ATP-binding cassette domain-containing protein [Methanoplanus endosymbiosus]UUX92954.1 ATP-binding cassette domain-containing protein [Methanoplanus endosymbiosus]
MKLTLNNITIKNGDFILKADGEFGRGIHLITGKIGSGKTSLAMAVAGFLKISGGRMDKSGISSEIYSMQNPEHHVTADRVRKEIISWGLKPEFITDKYGFEEIADDDPVLLSRGELKKLELACIIERNPDLLLLDEPFSSLDCVEKKRFISGLPDRKDQITIIFTHEQAVLPKADYIWETEKGRLICHGKTPEAILKWKNPPQYITEAISRGIIPDNITIDDVMEALCRMQE